MMKVLKDYQFALVALLQLVWFVVAVWYRKNVATREDVAGITTNLKSLEGRTTMLERAHEKALNKDDLAKLSIEMADFRGDMKTCQAEITGARDLFAAETRGLHALVDRTESMVSTLTQHLLSRER